MVNRQSLKICPITEDRLDAVLSVYHQCEDFLILGPGSPASMDTVLIDLKTSQEAGGVFCGIYDSTGAMIGVVDFIPRGFQGNVQHAFLSLLMMARSFRGVGIGSEVVKLVEAEILKDNRIHAIFSAVQINNTEAIRFWLKNGYHIVAGPTMQADGTATFQLRKEMRMG